jgi:hypothetical protein
MMVEPTIGRATESFHTKVPPCIAMDAEYKGYCGMGQRIPSFSEPRSSCIIICTCRKSLKSMESWVYGTQSKA